MSGQRNMLSEITVIVLITVAASSLVWHFTGHAAHGVTKIANIPTDTIERPHTRIDSAYEENRRMWSEGKSLFKSNCASCHNPKVAQTGPALMGVTARWEEAGMYQGHSGKYWLHEWIRDWGTVVKTGYPYAVKMENYSPSYMNRFPNLSDHDIDMILHYVETPDLGGTVPTVVVVD